MWRDLLTIAAQLAQDIDDQPPTQAALRRSVSTSYYALFSATSSLVADALIGNDHVALNSAAWARAYRSLEHGNIKSVAMAFDGKNAERKLRTWAGSFLLLQETRHRADYDPEYRISFTKAAECLSLAEASCNDLATLPPATALDFAAQIAFRTRR